MSGVLNLLWHLSVAAALCQDHILQPEYSVIKAEQNASITEWVGDRNAN